MAADNSNGEGPRVYVPVTVTSAQKTPTENTSSDTVIFGYHLTLSGTGTPGARLSLQRTVAAKSKLTFSATRTAPLTYTLAGTVAPALANQQVTVYTKTATTGYAPAGTTTSNAIGAWSLPDPFGSTGTYTVRTLTHDTARNSGNSLNSVLNNALKVQ